MLKLNYKVLLLFLINFNFSYSLDDDTIKFRADLIAEWESKFTEFSPFIVQRAKRELSDDLSTIVSSGSVDDFNSQSLVVIASEIDDDERVMKPVECLIKCVVNATELFLIYDNTLLEDEIIDQDQIKMYNRIKRSNGARPLDLRSKKDQQETEKFIRDYANRPKPNKPPLKKVQEVANNSFIILLDENSVYTPQVFIHHRPLRMDVDEGSSFQIKCSVSSIEDASLKWFNTKNEILTELSGLKYGTIDYYFDGIDVSQSGDYTCNGQNSFGTSKQVLNINVKPSRLSASILPTDNYLAETNQPHKLSCRVPNEFVRNTIITWFYNNQSALYNNDLTIDNDVIIIKKLNRNSNGVYSCSARMNKIIKSDYIDLKVEFPPELIGNPRITQNLYVRYDTNYTLSCEVANAVPEPIIIWDTMLRHNKRSNYQKALRFSENPDIVFTGFKPTDEGTYVCFGENPLGKTPIRTFHLFGQASAKPTIINTEDFPDKSKTIVVMKEDTVKFLTCKCENCMPLRTIKWFYNGNEITKIDSKPLLYSESFVGDNKIGLLPLTKANIKKSEEGQYKCYIENEFGSDEFTFDVKVVDFDTENLDEKANATQIKCELNEDKIHPVVIFKENNDTYLGYNTSGKSYENDTISAYGQSYTCTTYKLVYSKNPGFKLDNSPLDSFKLFTIIPNITNPALLAKVADGGQPDDKICKFNDTENLNGANVVRSCETEDDPIIVMTAQETEYPELNQDVELYKDIYITSKTNQFLYMCDLFPYSEKMTDKTSYLCSITSELGFGEDTFLLYRREKPSVSETVKDHVKILPGTKELITCEGFGNPEPEVYWTSPRGEKFLQIPEHPNKLEFSIVDEEIQGNYTCNAENIYGLSTKQTYVEIINVPKGIYSKNYLEITADPCHLKELVCPILNAKNFTWTRTLENADSKVFPMSFNGNYTCVAENEAGVSDFTYIVRDSEAPLSIVIHLSSPERITLDDTTRTETITTEIGTQLTAQCVVHGASPSASIRWLKDQQEYSSEETIEIGELQLNDMGEYSCTAGNEKGDLSISFQVNLLAPPKFKYDLGKTQTLPLPYGSSMSLDCTAFASPTPSFQWYYNGILMRNEQQETFRLENASAYTSGQYRCVVENPFGLIEREFIIETANPVTKPNVPTQIEITEPETLRLPCYVASSPSISTLYWIFDHNVALGRDNSPIRAALGPAEKIYFSETNELYPSENEAAENNERYGILSKSSDGSEITFELVIQNTRFNRDSGMYTCYLTNSVEQTESTVSVNILAKPQNVEPTHATDETDVTVPEFTQKTLDCAVDGNPESEYTWTLNGQPINQLNDTSVRLQYYGRLLHFVNITQSQSGTLICTGSNPLGEHTHIFNLNVEGPPKIVHPETNTIDEREVEDVIIDQNRPLKLQCPHIGNPTPNIEWIIIRGENQELLDELSDTIMVDPLQESATVYCTIENNRGFAKKMFNLVKLSPLHFLAEEPNQPVKVQLGSYLLLNCTMTGAPKPFVQWTKDGETIPDYDKFIYYIQNSVADDSGRYTCIGATFENEISRDFDVEVVSAQWDQWGEWSKCSVPCGAGTQYRSRRCLLNGQDARGMCDGIEVEVYECVQTACRPNEAPRPRQPVTTSTTAPPTPRPTEQSNLEPSIWSSWSECDLNCHDTVNKRNSMRKRYCLDPSLTYCHGRNQEVEQCNVPNCPIHGGWSAWIEGPCSVSCGEGVAKRKRFCNSPPPKHNGRTCLGNRLEAFPCKKLCS